MRRKLDAAGRHTITYGRAECWSADAPEISELSLFEVQDSVKKALGKVSFELII